VNEIILLTIGSSFAFRLLLSLKERETTHRRSTTKF